MWKAWIIVSGSVVALAAASSDRVIMPKWESDAITVSPTVERDLVQELRLGAYVARFEKTPLGEIREKIGAGTLERAGDASESVRWLCYSLVGQLVWLASDEMGGSDDDLTQVFAEAISPSDPRQAACPPMPSAFRPVSLEFGWIGSKEATIREILGEPSGIRGDWLLYLFAGKESGQYRGPGDATPRVVEYDITAYVEVKIQEGKATAVRATHVTSY